VWSGCSPVTDLQAGTTDAPASCMTMLFVRSAVILVALASVLVQSEQAIAQPQTTSERRDLSIFGGDVWSTWTSPARVSRHDLAPVGAAVGTIAITVLGDSVIGAWISKNQDALVMRMLAPVRDGWLVPLNELPTAPILPILSVATYAAGRLSNNSALSNAGLGCAATHLGGLGFRVIAYHSVSRARPARSTSPFHISTPGAPNDWYNQSFTGGHVTNAMACGTFLAQRYSFGAGEPLLYAYVVAIGLGRMADGWHWASDTMTGAIMGYAIGAATARRHRDRAERDAAAGLGATMTAPVPLFRMRITF
jgi:membrane-associated phospholipid phosphatase